MSPRITSERGTYTALCSSVLFPLHELAKGHDSRARRRALEESQWWPPERIELERVERLRAFLVSAGAAVPYYQDLFRSIGFDPRGLRSTADLAAIPFLTKTHIRSNTNALKAAGGGPLTRY